jgi:hypothetical protein
MPLTYNAFATTTLGTAASSITFSSISGSYTDLRISASLYLSTSDNTYLRFNGDTGTNYQEVALATRGGSAQNYQDTGTNFINLTGFSGNWPSPMLHDITIPNYADTFRRKCGFERGFLSDTSAGSFAYDMFGWNNTNAITSLTISPQTGGVTFLAGSTVTLYGIARA